MRDAKQAYAHIYGLEQMVEAGLDRDEAEELTAASFDQDILQFFGDAKGADNRKAMKSWLNYQKRTSEGRKTTVPRISELPVPPSAYEQDTTNSDQSIVDKKIDPKFSSINVLKFLGKNV